MRGNRPKKAAELEIDTGRRVRGHHRWPMSRAGRANPGGAEDWSREDHQVPDRTLALGPVRAANGAGLDVRARPAPKVVGGEWGHVSRMRDFGCSALGDDLKTAWTLGGGDAKRPPRS
jgi:hypothetical protein